MAMDTFTFRVRARLSGTVRIFKEVLEVVTEINARTMRMEQALGDAGIGAAPPRMPRERCVMVPIKPAKERCGIKDEALTEEALKAAGRIHREAQLSLACPRCGARVDSLSKRWECSLDEDSERYWVHRCLDVQGRVLAVSVLEWEEKKQAHARLQPLIFRCDWLKLLREDYEALGSRATHHEERVAEAYRMAGPAPCGVKCGDCPVIGSTGIDLGGHWPHDRWGEPFGPKAFAFHGCEARLEPDGGERHE